GNPFRTDFGKGTAAAEFLAEPPFLNLGAALDGVPEEDKWAAGPSSKKPQKKMPPPEIPRSSPPKHKPEQLRDLRVGIIGAGFTGLLLAHGLRRHGGVEVDI
ncbi:hypothetical protein D7B24_003869, partial [Verticillium nonalfalfae]